MPEEARSEFRVDLARLVELVNQDERGALLVRNATQQLMLEYQQEQIKQLQQELVGKSQARVQSRGKKNGPNASGSAENPG